MTWKSEKLDIPKTTKAKPITPEQCAASGSEDGHQIAVFCWAATAVEQYPQLKRLFAIPNGGSRHIVEAGKLVAAGTRSGVPDTCLPWPMKFSYSIATQYHGLYIEMKKEIYRTHKNGGVKPEQIEWHEYLMSVGYAVRTCYTWIEAKDVLIAYMEGRL